MSNNPFTGSLYFFKGFALITKPNIRKWVLIPLLINVILFSALVYYGWLQYHVFFEAVMNHLHNWLPNWEWLISMGHWLVLPLFIVVALFMMFFTFTFIANLIGAPFNGLLAEAVEIHLTGKTINSPTQSWYAFLIGIFWKPLGKIVYYLWWVIILLIISLIPPINIVSPVLWFLFAAWLVSLEYANAPMENHGYKPAAIRKILAKKRMLVLGFGSTVLVVMLIPLVNFLVMPVAVAGATCMWVNEFAESTPPLKF